MTSRKVPLSLLSFALTLLSWPAPVAAASTAAMPSDFNGDGYADMAVGSIYEDHEAGGITVLYGSPRGLTADGSQSFSQDTPGIKGKPRRDRGYDGDGSHFGAVLASGDFNRDGRADLAVGVPADTVGDQDYAGSVTVLYGSKHGLTARDSQRLTAANVAGTPQFGDFFGASLAAGDFDGDGFPDLAVGVPGEFDPPGTGIVQVLHGGSDGLNPSRTYALTMDMTGSSDPNLTFPASLAAGDLDGDGIDDLAAGAPDDSCDRTGCVTEGGDVAVYYGSGGVGLSGDGSQRWSQDSEGVLDASESNDMFGASLETGDFDGDGYGDLAIGVPGERVADALYDYGEGAVAVLYGTPTGLSADGNQRWDEDSPGVPGTPEHVGLFGAALAAGDFDGDGADDLAIGAPFHDVGSAFGAGLVVVLRGSAGDGLTSTDAQRLTQASAGVPSKPEDYDEFGTALAAADYGRSGRDDLAIGAPGEQVGKVWRAGMVNVLYGRTPDLSGINAQGWSQATSGVPGKPEQYDSFGSSLTP
jgi:hypothetical protein